MNEVNYNQILSQVQKNARQMQVLICSTQSYNTFCRQRNTKRMKENKTPEKLLKSIFGYDSFRPLQREVIQNILDGQDTIAVMPTGGGKSITYEISSLILEGLTIVISPLISLMQDQVRQLENINFPAAFLNSTQDWQTYLDTYNKIKNGEIKLLYLSPESLSTKKIQNLLHEENITLSCITIDEAHCISEWGHDFRPDYLEIACIREQFPKAVCLALTATATSTVRNDIAIQLKMENPAILVSSFNRPNIFLQVEHKKNSFQQILDFIQTHSGESGIIYCFSRKQVDTLYEKLLAKGIKALNYHAGLDDETRSKNQDDFINDKVDIMVATLAFGMGINKSDVRYVIHQDIPKSIEQYYQEIGRAGRDGLNATALLLYSSSDINKIRYFFTESNDRVKAESLLQKMMNYAEKRVCRRKQLLMYFNEVYDEKQNSEYCCDICSRGVIEENDVTIPAQKFLSNVLRTNERYGLNYLVDILTGSKSSKIIERGHNKLSTWGIGKDLSKETWEELGNCLIEEGYLYKESEYNVLYVTDYGRRMLQSRSSIYLRIDISKQKEKKTIAPKPGIKINLNDSLTEKIFDELRAWRKKAAEEMRLPPYIILSDKSIIDIANHKPKTNTELLECYGIGENKAEKFGWFILRIIKNNC